MSRILRHRKAEGDKTGWFESEVLKTELIDEIKNPDAKTVDTPPRSIPSPFAPLDLARSAMDRYIKGDESPQVQRILSEVLDVGVLFFTLSTRALSVECVRFDFSDLDVWQNEANDSHGQLPAAMSRYRRNDEVHYGFDKVTGLYLLREKNNPEHVLGGTCPQTMFFVAPGPKPWARQESLGGDTLFDDQLKQLHERYSDYVLWLYRLGQRIKEEPGGAYTPFARYLDYCLSRKLPDVLAREIRDDLTANNGSADYEKHYRRLNTSVDQQELEVYGNVILCGEDGELTNVESDFTMVASAVKTIDKPPLAIPQSPSGGGYSLLKDEPFDRNKHRPPLYDPRPLGERHLPGLPGKVYPYLTVDDFLEPYLLEIPYPADRDHFLTCYSRASAGDRPEELDYLLPLKPLFFDYFTAEDLVSKKGGTPSFTLKGQRQRGYVEFCLNIPLRGGKTARFERQYENREEVDADGRSGGIRNLNFGLAMYPDFVDREAPGHQRLLYTSKESQYSSAGRIELFDSATSDKPQVVGVKQADWAQGDLGARLVARMLQPQASFDGIRVYGSGDLDSGVLIPVKTVKGVSIGPKAFSFAIDFGTTNTHIEVAVDGKPEQPLTIPGTNPQLAALHGFSSFAANGFGQKAAREILDRNLLRGYQNRPEELLPSLLGGDFPVGFPIRTATVETGDIEHVPVVASLQVCIPWKYQVDPYKDVKTDLKWSPVDKEGLASKRAKAFIDTLCLIMRNHVIDNDGRLRDTNLVWFYPTSMNTYQKSSLGVIWREAYTTYFGDDAQAKVTELTESLAPMYAYVAKQGVITAGERPAVSIDIGGGSTDIAVWAERKVQVIDSFRLAGNAVFGDGEGYMAESNGFIRHFGPIVKKALEHNTDLNDVYNSIPNDSANLINFWFGLRDHPLMDGRDFDFAKKLAGTPAMRVPFVVFFGAVTYRAVQLLKTQSLPLPRDLTFSGNGSRMLSFLSDDPAILRTFFQQAMQAASGGDDPDYRLRQVSWDRLQPKEITSKGGLAYLNEPDLDDSWRGTVVPSRTYGEVNNPDVVAEEVAGFADFVRFLREFLRSYNVNDQLGIGPVHFNAVWPILEDGSEVRTFMRDRIEALQEKNSEESEQLGEQLFFFPLRRMLPLIAQAMAKQSA